MTTRDIPAAGAAPLLPLRLTIVSREQLFARVLLEVLRRQGIRGRGIGPRDTADLIAQLREGERGVVVLDLDAAADPGVSSTERTARVAWLREHGYRVLAVCERRDEALERAALTAGAVGVAHKTSCLGALAATVRRAVHEHTGDAGPPSRAGRPSAVHEATERLVSEIETALGHRGPAPSPTEWPGTDLFPGPGGGR